MKWFILILLFPIMGLADVWVEPYGSYVFDREEFCQKRCLRLIGGSLTTVSGGKLILNAAGRTAYTVAKGAYELQEKSDQDFLKSVKGRDLTAAEQNTLLKILLKRDML